MSEADDEARSRPSSPFLVRSSSASAGPDEASIGGRSLTSCLTPLTTLSSTILNDWYTLLSRSRASLDSRDCSVSNGSRGCATGGSCDEKS